MPKHDRLNSSFSLLRLEIDGASLISSSFLLRVVNGERILDYGKVHVFVRETNRANWSEIREKFVHLREKVLERQFLVLPFTYLCIYLSILFWILFIIIQKDSLATFRSASTNIGHFSCTFSDEVTKVINDDNHGNFRNVIYKYWSVT